MAQAEVRGISIVYDDSGRQAKARERALLLIHGHPFDRAMWQPQARAAAAAGWRVIVPDLRGYGETSVVPGKTGLETFAEDLVALLDVLGVDRIVVGGLSMGGQIAMEFARLHPRRIQGLLLAATFPRPDSAEVRALRLEVADRLEREGMADYADDLLPKMLAASSIEARPALARYVRSMMRRQPPLGAAAALRGRAERPSYEPALAGLKAPALIVAGDQDAFTTREDAERMRALLSQGQLLWLTGVGHMPNLESPDEFNDALLDLLGGLDRGRSAVRRSAVAVRGGTW